MSNNSLSALLEKLESVQVTLGWGAVFAFSRERINRILEQQFTAAFNAFRFIKPFSDELDTVKLTGVVFGAPTMSFENADLHNATATVHIPLLAGRYDVLERIPGRSPVALQRRDIDSAHGAVLTLQIDLEQVNSDSDNTGRVAVDLTRARNPRCTLAADPELQQEIGEHLLAHLRKEPANKTTFVLAVVNAGNYTPLNPVQFMIRTQPAPGARDPGARNAGDGAVLVYMKVQAYNLEPEGEPDADYPYLIPDDMNGGVPQYSAALFVHRDLGVFVNDENLQVLKNSVLPTGYAFVQTGQAHVPADHAMFGNVVNARSNVRIEPVVSDIRMLEALDFTARWGDGSPVTGVDWSSTCLNSPLLKGDVSPQGRFTAKGYPFAGPSVLLTTVTARFTGDGQEGEASAFVLVRFHDLALDPLLSTREPGGAAVLIQASGPSAEAGLDWTLLPPTLGSLQDDGDQASYAPPAQGGAPLVAQRLQARNDAKGHHAQAVVMLVTQPETLPVEPPFVGAFAGQGEMTFEVPAGRVRDVLEDGAGEDDVFWRWSVVGEGTVIGDGRVARFTPPASRVQQSLSVVVCEMIGPEVGHVCGHAVVDLSKGASAREEPHWEKLNVFKLEADQGNEAYENGMQQVRVRIRIETESVEVDGFPQHIPISANEIASLRLVELTTRQAVAALPETQEGIEHESNTLWATSTVRNRFNLLPGVKAETPEGRVHHRNGVTYVDLYVHLKTDQTVDFYAEFDMDKGGVASSLDYGVEPDQKVRLQGKHMPPVGKEDYVMERERVWGGDGYNDGDDEFSFWLQSIDFWRVAFRKSGFDELGFATLRIEQNASTIQWESELLDEEFFSYTTWAFSEKSRKPAAAPTALAYDAYLGRLLQEVGHDLPDTSLHDRPPSPGQLVVALHREDDVRYWHDSMAGVNPFRRYRQALDKPMVYVLRDEYGNRHRLQIGFENPSIIDSRNTLVLLPI